MQKYSCQTLTLDKYIISFKQCLRHINEVQIAYFYCAQTKVARCRTFEKRCGKILAQLPQFYLSSEDG